MTCDNQPSWRFGAPTSKASSGRINPREVGHIRRGLRRATRGRRHRRGSFPPLPGATRHGDLLARLDRELVEEPAAAIGGESLPPG